MFGIVVLVGHRRKSSPRCRERHGDGADSDTDPRPDVNPNLDADSRNTDPWADCHPVAGFATSTTGLKPWWTYEQKAVPGVGAALVNVFNGNLVVTATDFDVPERGVDLSFTRTYNSQSAHDTVGTDGATPSLYGNGWTNSFDAHIAYNATSRTMSVYDSTGARYDYAANASACTTLTATACWTPPAGMQGTTLASDGGTGYYWTLKNGTVYYFWSPSEPAASAGYAGRTYEIIGRNHNNYIRFTYAWTNSDSSTIKNLTQINVVHSDGQYLNEIFALFGANLELASTAPV